jgi:hypothetical protein
MSAHRKKRSTLPQGDSGVARPLAQPGDALAPSATNCNTVLRGGSDWIEGVPASLRFENRERLSLAECAAKLKATSQHLLNLSAQGAFGDEGKKLAKLKPSQRMITVAAWRRFVASRYSPGK